MIDLLYTRRRIYGMWARLSPSEDMPQGMVSTCNIKAKNEKHEKCQDLPYNTLL